MTCPTFFASVHGARIASEDHFAKGEAVACSHEESLIGQGRLFLIQLSHCFAHSGEEIVFQRTE